MNRNQTQTMGLLAKKHRWFMLMVVVIYFLSIFLILNFTAGNETFLKAMNEYEVEMNSFRTSSQKPIEEHKNDSIVNPREKSKLVASWLNLSLDTIPTSKLANMTSMPKDEKLISIEKPNHAVKITLTSDEEKIDWNDYTLMAKESLRQGPGEHSAAFAQNLTAEQQTIMNSLKERYKYNAYASDIISLERSLKDTRTDVCKKKLFLKNLPQNSVSFVVIFNNERNTTLLRTIYGIVNRSPERLLREIVLVDDLSTNEELKDPLEDYISKHFMKVRILRNKERQGLIRSRIIGANHTSGSFLVFLDAHVEVNVNFLPPLIEPMVLDYRTIVCPMVDNTVAETLEVRGINRERGAFDWGLTYQRLPVHQEDESVPHNVTSMIGCAIAISRQWWEEIGMFDPGLEIWGGEQFEISFKSWMCGGKVVDAPCSRVSHIFRPLPYVKHLMDNKLDQKNLLRVALVWMDEYKEYFFQRRPLLRNMDPGDLRSQYELRKRLKCKSFDWFMKEVAPDIPKYFPLIEPPLMAWGKIKDMHNSSLCLAGDSKFLTTVKCSHRDASSFVYDWRLQIRRYDKCFCNPGRDYLLMWACFLFEDRPTELFVWHRASGRIINGHTKYCVEHKKDTPQVYTAECNSTSLTQSWTFEVYNATLVDSIWEQNRHLFNFTLT